MKKFLGITLTCLMAVATLSSCSGGTTTTTSDSNSNSTEFVTLIVASNQTSADNPYHFGLAKFKEVLEKESNGKMLVEVHDGTLGTNENELVDKLNLGAADMVVASPGFMTSLGVKEVDMLSLLYLFNSFEDWNDKLTGEFGNKMKDIINTKTNNDFKVLSYWSSGVRDYYGKTPLNTPEDAKGLKIRTQSSPVQQQFWKDCGAIPTSIDWNELYQALQQGVVDAAENDYTNLMQKDHHKTKNGKYITETDHDFTTRLLLMNGKAYDKFTDEEKKWIDNAAAAATIEEISVVKQMKETSKEKVIADGGEVNSPDLAPFKEIAINIQDKFAKDNNLEDLLALTRAK